MDTLTWWVQVSRPGCVLLAGVGVWAAAVLSGPNWMNGQIAAAIVLMAIACAGANVFHFGHNHELVTRKGLVAMVPGGMTRLTFVGFLFVFLAVVLALVFLPFRAFIITAIDAFLIILYPKVLSRFWATKNATIAGVTASVVLVGAIAGGGSTSEASFLTAAIFFAWLGREIMNDIVDADIDRGSRVTLPLRIGPSATKAIASLFILTSAGLIFLVGLSFIGESLLTVLFTLGSVGCFLGSIYVLIDRLGAVRPRFLVTLGLWSFVLAALANRIAIKS